MADYFTNFSFIVSLQTADQQAQALDLFHQMQRIQQGEKVPPAFPSPLRELAEDCWFEAEASDEHNLWLHSTNGGIDAVCAFVQYLLQLFQLPATVSFEWSHDCTKPRTDAYGGGAALITRNEIKTFSTSDWVRQQTETSNPG